MKAGLPVALLVSVCLCAPASHANPEFQAPKLTEYATDLTGTLSAEELAVLNDSLRAFDRMTSTQVVVLMVPSIDGDAIEDASLKVAELNRIGVKGRDNGALLLIAKDDRKLRIEVGLGLEGVLTDALSGIIIRKEIAPHFRKGDYFGGIAAGVSAIMAATRGEYSADQSQGPDQNVLTPFLVLAIVVFVMLRSVFRNRRYSAMGRRGGPPFWWGGFPPLGGGRIGGGGFGGGGFSGGGGSFGGGGASGGW